MLFCCTNILRGEEKYLKINFTRKFKWINLRVFAYHFPLPAAAVKINKSFLGTLIHSFIHIRCAHSKAEVVLFWMWCLCHLFIISMLYLEWFKINNCVEWRIAYFWEIRRCDYRHLLLVGSSSLIACIRSLS